MSVEISNIEFRMMNERVRSKVANQAVCFANNQTLHVFAENWRSARDRKSSAKKWNKRRSAISGSMQVTLEFISKMQSSLQELDETAYWLELLVDSNIVKAKTLEDLRREADELTAIFVSSVKTARSKSS
jgi:tRNA(Phe) wybutosine-synthesizing methylase Tyw3